MSTLSLRLRSVRYGATTALRDVEARLQYTFRDRGLLEHALTHKSRAAEDPSGGVVDNESLEFLGDLVARRAEVTGGPTKHPGPGVLGPVHAMAEAHESLLGVEDVTHVSLRVPGALDFLHHVQHS